MTEPEDTHLLLYKYVEDMAERRIPYREAHLAHINAARDAGQLVIAGGLGDPVAGGALGFKGLTRADVEAWSDDDPYWKAGLVVERIVEPWKLGLETGGRILGGVMAFPQTRMRRLRATRELRGLVRETQLSASDFVYPLFVAEGLEGREPIWTMPGIDRLSVGEAVAEAGSAAALGIPAVILFGIPATKDAEGSGAYDDDGIVQLATRAIKQAHPDLLVITDLCLCEYTDHGHCGVVREVAGPAGATDYASTTTRRSSCSPAPPSRRRRPGADIVAPERHDGRAHRRDPRGARRGRPHRDADHGLLVQVRLGLLRPVP